MFPRKWIAALTVAAGTVAPAFAAEPAAVPKASALTFGTLRTASPEAVKAKVEGFLKAEGKLDQAKLDEIWKDSDRTILDRTVQSIGLARPDATKAIADARKVNAPAFTTIPAAIAGEKNEFAKANLAAAFAKALAGKRVYEEAVLAAKSASVKAEEIVEPASFYFFKAVAEFSLIKKDDATASITRLLDDVADAPDRYRVVATQMFFDIQQWAKDPKDLTNIAKLMDNSERRLDLDRAGRETQDIQKKIIFRLDEKIKELENKAKGGGAGNGGACPDGGAPGDPQGNQPNGTPADKSALPNSGASKGDVDPAKLRQYAANWGKLPAAERAKAVQEMKRDLPAKYQPMIEEYIKSLNRMNGYDK